MKDEIRTLAKLRATLAEQTALISKCEAENAATPEWRALQAANAEAQITRSLITDAENRVRALALSAYRNDGNKAPLKGIAIKIYKRLVYDAQAAEAWCRQNAPTLFKWDVKGFEKAAETLPGAPVTVEEDPRVTIATDLGEYLK